MILLIIGFVVKHELKEVLQIIRARVFYFHKKITLLKNDVFIHAQNYTR
jgi:hypothetical protein